VLESAIKQVLPYADYVLYDLKHMNSHKHYQYTGKSNTLILKNAKVVAQSGVELLFRMPLIPSINDDMQNIKDTAEFLKGLGKNTTRIELMSYHRLGKGKYESLNKEYRLSDIPVPDPINLELAKKMFESNGISCLISK